MLTVAASGAVATEGVPGASRVEDTVRHFFQDIEVYDFAAMRAAATPQFQIIDKGYRRDLAELIALLRDERQAKDFKYQFRLSNFDTVVAPVVAYTTFVSHERFSRPLAEGGEGDYINGVILKRSGNRWLVDRVFHMTLKPEGGK
ncbi:MAG: hypothetical protein ACREU6_18690 [Steroidobacteraceae bacterium]